MANLDDLLSTYDYLDNRWFCTSRARLYYPTHILNLTITQAGSIRTIPHPVISLWGRESLLLRRSKTMKWWRREELQSAVNSLPDLSFSGGSDLSTIWICQNFDTLCPLSSTSHCQRLISLYFRILVSHIVPTITELHIYPYFHTRDCCNWAPLSAERFAQKCAEIKVKCDMFNFQC